jgi:hypothetical protein
MIICKDVDGTERRFKNVRAALRYINADRSEEFLNYTRHDWRDGMESMTDLTIVKVTKG